MTRVAQFIRRSKSWRCGARSITPATLRHAITTCHTFVIFLMSSNVGRNLNLGEIQKNRQLRWRSLCSVYTQAGHTATSLRRASMNSIYAGSHQHFLTTIGSFTVQPLTSGKRRRSDPAQGNLGRVPVSNKFGQKESASVRAQD